VEDTAMNDYFVNSWTHGTGVSDMSWHGEVDQEWCTAVVPEYKYDNNTELGLEVLASDVFHDALENVVNFPAYLKNKKTAAPVKCSSDDSQEDCFKFSTYHIDADILFKSDPWAKLDGTSAANLAAAIGSAKYEIKNATVRYKNVDYRTVSYDIKATVTVYDFYDFNMGKKEYYFIDYNSDGAWIQLGYEGSRLKGSVFTTLVVLDVTYNVTCEDPLLFGEGSCLYSDGFIFSVDGDFE
jgi:hypothetical protein